MIRSYTGSRQVCVSLCRFSMFPVVCVMCSQDSEVGCEWIFRCAQVEASSTAQLCTTKPQRETKWELLDFVLLMHLVDVVTAVALLLFLFRLTACRSPLFVTLLYLLSFSLRGDFEGKSQRARCRFLRSWLNRDPWTHLLIWWVCVNMLVLVYMRWCA